jgi:hypothetical protein
MRSLNIFRLRLRSLFFRGRVEQELADEFQYHLEREIQTNIALGMTPDDARRRAVTSMEGLEQRKEECRDMRALNLIDNAMPGSSVCAQEPGQESRFASGVSGAGSDCRADFRMERRRQIETSDSAGFSRLARPELRFSSDGLLQKLAVARHGRNGYRVRTRGKSVSGVL